MKNKNGEGHVIITLLLVLYLFSYLFFFCFFCRPTGKKHRKTHEHVIKPAAVADYNIYMGGVDRADQCMTYYAMGRRGKSWWRCLFVHLFNQMVFNAFKLYSMYGEDRAPFSESRARKLSSKLFREYLALYLTSEMTTVSPQQELFIPGLSKSNSRCSEKTSSSEEEPRNPPRLQGRHFPGFIGEDQKKRKNCRVCFVGRHRNDVQHRKNQPYRCLTCDIPMCIVPCFRLFHTEENYTAAIRE